ncbi:MAG: DNA repair ATPase, partial [Deltaproteobacteria bacterium]|nr:DNA repair ATPase [Deltaproteobacteria bacterium]
MSQTKQSAPAKVGQAEEPGLEGGSYEVIRRRLLEQARALGEKADALNARRKELFGGTELQVVGNARVRTENNCVPRDIVSLGERLLVGYNVFLGLKTETTVADVYSLYRFEKTAEGYDFTPVPLSEADGLLTAPQLLKDFSELYRYYRDAKLLELCRAESRLLSVFRTGATLRDLKVLRWSLDPEGRATYVDNRGERDFVNPPSHDFEWTPATPESYVRGRHPHVSILDEVFVDTVKGDLTIKIENNTEDGLGIWREPVDDPDQSLDDASIQYARLGALILIKVLPFREQVWRHLVFNTRTKSVHRVDAIGLSCVQLPEDHGVVFPGGYALQTGEVKVFELEARGLQFSRALRAPNGEDVLYVFHSREEGRDLLLPYNLVRKEVQSPIQCHGHCLFADGTLAVFRESDEPTRVHPIQIWQTPFASAEHADAAPQGTSYLVKIGNAELVRGISEVYTLKRLAEAERPTCRTYEDLIAATTRAGDAWHWLGHAEAGLLGPIQELGRTAGLIVDEFEKVLALRRQAESSLATAQTEQERLLSSTRPEDLVSVDAFMDALAALRRQRGRLITLREVRYLDLERLDALEKGVVAKLDEVSVASLGFLEKPEALQPVCAGLEALLPRIAQVEKTPDLAPLKEEAERQGQGVEALSEVIAGLQVGDPTVRTRILESVSEVFALANRVRAVLQGRRKELARREGVAEFGAQFKVFAQNAESSLASCDSPERCDEHLSRVLVQLEELEGRFGELDEFVEQLTRKREEVAEAFAAKRQALLDERNRRARNLYGAAERILAGAARRARSFKTADELNTYFSTDPMVLKLRALAEQLLAAGDGVRADEVRSRLKAAQQDGLRALRDRQDLYEEGDAVIKLGAHRFQVVTQPFELTAVPRDGALALHLTGTDFYQPLDDPRLAEGKDYWDQVLVSESPEVSRAEHLAAAILFDAEDGARGLSIAKLQEASRSEGGLLALTRACAAERYDEGYERGVHDVDAAAILAALLSLRETAGLLRFAPGPRAMACLFWAWLVEPDDKRGWALRARSLGRLREAFRSSPVVVSLAGEISERIAAAFEAASIPLRAADARLAGRYLVEELMEEELRFATSGEALALRDAFLQHLESRGARRTLEEDLKALQGSLPEALSLAKAWLEAFLEAEAPAPVKELSHVLLEAVSLLLTEGRIEREPSAALAVLEIKGLLGQHGRVVDGAIKVRLDELVARLGDFVHLRAPAWRAYRKALAEVLEHEKRALRLEELKPGTLST